MAKNKASPQGLVITIIGVFFLILTTALYGLKYINIDRLLIFYGLSIFLVIVGVVIFTFSKRIAR
jgi:hypothetical protein